METLSNCPQICNNAGGYKKTNLAPKEVESKNAGESPSLPLHKDPDKPSSLCPPVPAKMEYLPGLAPGLNGKVNWTPLADMTGTRPVVNKYSISRYSLGEWTAHNEHVVDPIKITEANIIDYNSQSAIMRAFGSVDKLQNENNTRLKQKARDIFRWKTEVESAIKSMTEEVELLEFERQRLKGASRTLMVPEAISKECLELRTNRAEPDLVADAAEQSLIKEMNMVKDVRANFTKTLQAIEAQLVINKAAKHKMEYDWCDKTLAYETDCVNLGLNTKSNTLLFRPGAARFGEFSAPLEYWEYFCRENILNCEAARQTSVDLRGSLKSILDNGGRKLRLQGDATDMAIAETVALTTELCSKLEETLKNTLRKIADVEMLIERLHDSIRKMDAAMKLAQTRLDNRNIWRCHGESVMDQPHIGLIDEVRKIHQTVTALRSQLNQAKAVKVDLMNKRVQLEKDIASKRKTLSIDRDRCGMIRSHFPTASELAGY